MSTFAESGRLLVCFVVGAAIGVYVTLVAITVATKEVGDEEAEMNAASRRGAPTDRKPREN